MRPSTAYILNLVIEFRPRAFVIENVPGLRDLDGGEQLSAAIEKVSEAGYKVEEPFILDAAQHGVHSQSGHRVPPSCLRD